ncbi:DUF2206 domain-containing protein [Halococcoides cellulosivorans]|uniref:DUF2206 domain-containing protein n=1 Tax=Halococcoides cellulosivorans TaxID=1679096 RepID=UPI00131F1400|nr:DUF2206 domain-containing protein [Halococcoides cellulosivorans]
MTGRTLLGLTGFFLVGIVVPAVLDWIGPHLPLVRPVFAVAFLLFVPGAFAYLALGAPERSLATTLCYIYGLSLASIMAIGGVASLVLPLVGIDRPLTLPVLVGLSAVLATLVAVWSDSTIALSVRTEDIVSPVPLALLLLPFASVFGTTLYSVGGVNALLLALLGVIGVIPVGVAMTDRGRRYLPLAVWSISLSLVYHGRLFDSFTITQPLPNLTMELGRWVPNYASGIGSLLANGVLYPVFAVVTGLPMALEWNLVNPFIVAVLPVALYEAYRRYTSPTGAFLAACIFMFAYSFYVLYPTGGRAATPVIFLALLALATSDSELVPSTRHKLALLFGAGVAVTHYGTAYVVMFALIAGGFVFPLLKLLHVINLPALVASRISEGRLRTHLDSVAERSFEIARPAILSPWYVAYYATLALAWYLHTGLGGKYSTLPTKVLDGVRGVMYAETSGSAVSSFQQDYSAVSITVAKYLYVVFGLLMAAGIAIAIFRLVVDREEVVPTGHLALGIGFFAMFGGSALPSGNAFAVARVMMIIFTFTVPFVVIGLDELPSLLNRLHAIDVGRSLTATRTALAVVIAVFFLLNSGFVAETITNDYAPSNQVSEQRLLASDVPRERLQVRACVPCDVRTHVWLGDNVPQGSTIYGDVMMGNQLDFYAGTIQSRTGQSHRYQMVNSTMDGLPPNAYLGLLGHNLDLQGFSIGYKFNFYETDLGPYTDGHVLYVNDHAKIVRERNTTRAERVSAGS